MPDPRLSQSIKKSIIVSVLIILSFWGNYFHLPLFYNVDFLFGSIFTLLLTWFKAPWGFLSALAAGSYTYVLWNHPWALIIVVSEAVFLRLMLNYKRADNIVLLDTAYWLFIGMPLVWIFYHLIMGMGNEAVFLIMLKQGSNGIFNALTAALISFTVSFLARSRGYTLIPVRLTYRTLLHVVLSALIIFPTLVIFVVSSRYEVTKKEREIVQVLERMTGSLEDILRLWLERNLESMEALAGFISQRDDVASDEVQQLLRSFRLTDPSIICLGILNEGGVLVLGEPSMYDNRPAVGHDYSDRLYFRELKKTQKPQVSEILISKIDGVTPQIITACPLVRDGKLDGCLMAAIDLRQVSNKMQDISRHWQADFTVVDRNHKVVFTTMALARPGQSYEELRPGQIHTTDRGLGVYTTNVDKNISIMQRWKDSSYLISSHIETPTRWDFIVELPVGPLMKDMFNLGLNRMTFMMISAILTVIIAYLLSGKLVSPITRLQDVTTGLPDKVVKGGQLAWPDSNIYEVHFLVENFKSMAATLEDKFNELKVINQDLREAKKNAEDASLAKSEFLAMMSHEIRTPLNAILGMAEIVLQTVNKDDESRDQIMTIRDSAHILLDLIKDILDFSKIEAGRLDLETVDFDLTCLLERLGRTMGVQCENKGIDLRVKIEDGTPMVLKGDPARLQQILVNLLGNAIKFTDRGGVDLTAALSVKEPIDRDTTTHPGTEYDLLFTVKDTGIGIPEDKLASIFAKFQQADSSINRKFGGSGLGLSICKHLVEMMNGQIKVESRPGSGSTFSFNIIMAAGDPKAIEECDEPVAEIRPRIRTEAAILIADDNPINIKVAKQALEKMGYLVTPAATGVEALDLIVLQRFDLVLMDLEMPDMSGLEAARLIRAGQAGRQNIDIPVIAVTAHAISGFREKCLEAGMNDYVTKPVDFPMLDSLIQNLLTENDAYIIDYLDPEQKNRISMDTNVIMNRFDGDENLFFELFEMFIEQLKDKIEQFEKLVKNYIPGEIAKLAHSLKGSAGIVGAERCGLLAEHLEKADENHDLYSANKVLSGLTDELVRLKDIYKNLKNKSGPEG